MIPAKHGLFAGMVFKPYLRRLLRRHFSRITLVGEVPELPQDRPALMLPNHQTWWDGFFAFVLNERFFHRPLYLMMLESQLRRYPFFARLGAYSIDPGSPAAILASLRYTLEIFARTPPPLVCIFPEGELVPARRNGIAYRRGINTLSKQMNTPLSLLQCGIRAGFGSEQRPEAWVRFGQPQDAGQRKGLNLRTLEEKHRSLLLGIDEAIREGVNGETVFTGKRSVNRTVDALAGTGANG